MLDGHPLVYIIGGPNGAGKTTAALSIMPGLIDCYEYVNADAIAAGLSPFRPSEVPFEAGRLMLKRIRDLAAMREDFAFETTMASRSFAPFLLDCRRIGYLVQCVYLWLHSAELAVARVADRVENGGHFVPDEIVRQRFMRGIENFFRLYIPIADSWALYDNSEAETRLVAQKLRGGGLDVEDLLLWKRISEAYL
jgi:predicted ABC-type ATPase